MEIRREREESVRCILLTWPREREREREKERERNVMLFQVF